MIDLQNINENIQKKLKKYLQKKNIVLKKCVHLHRFNKQLIVLQIKKQKKMKKLAFLFVAVAAVSFASCGNKAEQNTCDEVCDTVAVEEVEEIVDTVAVDTIAAPEAE